ncbi:MAG TPA: SDR family NAD(P)-dependent oxidoreductase [Candidatus Micrarchaeaceae archaeon]|nr:SDR family NAD(P)-dependent oxidoreductase [Candidatus Micrarchaeaceae archaeon]
MTGTSSLDGRVVVVTGAAGGLGREICRNLAVAGARVALVDLPGAPDLAEVAESVGGLVCSADISDSDQVRSALRRAEEGLGPVNGLVANAAFMAMGALTDQAPEVWWRQIEINLIGTFHTCQAAAQRMVRQGGGAIVVVASEWGVTGWPLATAYAASKGGLVALTKTLGREMMPHGVRVNALAPGVIDTPQLEVDALAAGVSRVEIRERYAEAIPLGRVATPAEIAGSVRFLLSDESSGIVGQVLQPNGGTTRARA